MKKIWLFILLSVLFTAGCNKSDENTEIVPATETHQPQPEKNLLEPAVAYEPQPDSWINPEGTTLRERFLLPEHYERVETGEGSFEQYLQMLPMKADGTKVHYYDGTEKAKDVYLGVVDFSLGSRDLQQCADSVMRLRAEYLYSRQRYDEISFHFVSGFRADFSKWRQGYGISVKGNEVTWISKPANNDSYESFQSYLDIVYAYASTLSLEKELISKSTDQLGIGDVFIVGGSPGHCVIVVDMAVNKQNGETLFMLAQGYMPAQDIQILRGDQSESPWYSLDQKDTLVTPEWQFQLDQLRGWP